MEKEIESAKKRLKEKYNFEFPVVIVNGTGGSIQPTEIRIGRENDLEIIEVCVIHEAYHIIFNIDQRESFKEKDKGNVMPYFQQEMWIWNKIRTDFPELSWQVGIAIMGEMVSLGLIK